MGSFIFIALVIAVLVFGKRFSKAQKLRESWSQAANHLGIRLQDNWLFAPPSLQGRIDGFPVSVYVVSQDSKGVPASTVFKIAFPRPLPVSMRLTRETILGENEETEKALTFLTSRRRAALTKFFLSFPEARIDQAHILWQRTDVPAEAVAISSAVHSLLRFARAFYADEAAEPDLSLPVGPFPEARVAPMEPGHSPGKGEKGEKGEDAALAPMFEREKPAPVEHIPTPPPEPTPSLSDGEFAPPAVAEKLFAHRNTSFDAQRLFDQSYRGRIVHWKGPLVAAEEYSFDLAFGSKPGVKATFELCNLPVARYDGSKVFAVVQLAPNAFAELRGREGQTFAFAGKLVKLDGFMRSILLAEGEIIAG